MKTYKNTSGKSQVEAFQIYKDAIKIQFTNGTVYLYTHEKSGKHAVETMKILALEHKGLGSYINENTYIKNAEKLEE